MPMRLRAKGRLDALHILWKDSKSQIPVKLLLSDTSQILTLVI